MSRIFTLLTSIGMIALLLTPGCCHNMTSTSTTNVVPLADPNDFVKSTVMLIVRGEAVITAIGEEVKKIPTGVSASAVAIDKKHLLTAAHFCSAVLQGWSEKGIVESNVLVTAKITLEKNLQMVYLNNNEELMTLDNVKIVALDTKKDICLVELKRHGIVPVRIAKANSAKRGDKVYIVGAALGVPFTMTDGLVSMVSLSFQEKEMAKFNGMMLSSAPATSGNSGGGCFNDKGELIGLLIAGAESYDHMSIITPAKNILSFLRKNHSRD